MNPNRELAVHDLSIDNVNRIINDVRKQEITYSNLADELIDHICCDVENEKDNGLYFLEAYQKISQKIGKHRLQKIQEETLYAVDSKYRQMKNTMKISAVAGTVMLGFATLFKIMHWPGAGIMMTLGTLMLGFIFITVGSLAVTLPSALISLNLQRSYDQGYFINLNQQNALFSYLYEITDR